jgi:hypothetical protein
MNVKPIDENSMREICGGIWPGGYAHIISQMLNSGRYGRKEPGMRPPMAAADANCGAPVQATGRVAPVQQWTD